MRLAYKNDRNSPTHRYRAFRTSGRSASLKSARDFFDLTGRTVIVTGGSVGLGRQMADGLAEMGANLVLCARKKDRCVQAAEELQKLGVKTLALGCGVKNPADIHGVVDASLAAFDRIDVLINNAGTSRGRSCERDAPEHCNKSLKPISQAFVFCRLSARR